TVRYCLDNSPGSLGFNVARTLGVKVEPNHAGAQFGTGSCVSDVRDAANFDLHRSHDWRAPVDVTCRSSAAAVKLRRAVSGSPARMSASPIRKPRNPSLRRRHNDSAFCSPLSLIIMLSGGTSAIRRSLVFNEIWNVFRSRLFAPMIFEPASKARRSSPD